MKYFLQVGIGGAVLIYLFLVALTMCIEMSLQVKLPLPIKNNLTQFITGAWVFSVALAHLFTWTIPAWYGKWKSYRDEKRKS